MSENEEPLTEEEKANNRKKSIIFFFLTATLMTGIWWQNAKSDCEDGTYCISTGKEWRLSSTGFKKSINGLTKVEGATATLVLANGKTHPVTVTSYDNDEWGNVIDTESWEISNISVSSITEDLTINLAFQIPEIEGANNTKATLTADALVIYPKFNGSDDMAGRSFKDNFSFEDARETVNFDVDLVLSSADQGKPFRIPGFIFWTILVIGGLLTFAYFGNSLDDPEEDL